jgi:uroporphyrinogen III methyltransferase/synthase
MPSPLAQQTILVTRSAGQSSQFTVLLQQQGATVLEMPTLEITPPSSWEPLDQAIATIRSFDWLILTSANGVDYFFDRFAHLGHDLEELAALKIAVVGKKTAASLQQRGRQPDYIPPNFVADSLVECFPEADRFAQLKLLFPRVETGGREVLVKEFSAKGATVIEVPAYESGCAKMVPPEVLEALNDGTIDIITFASSKTVRCFCQLLGVGIAEVTQGRESGRTTSLNCAIPAVASIGPQTSITCQELLGKVDIEAEDYTLEGLTQAIVKWVTTG